MLCFGCPAPASGADPPPRLRFAHPQAGTVAGAVVVVRGSDRLPATHGMQIRAGDRIEVGGGATAVLEDRKSVV